MNQFQANGYHGTGVAAILEEARAPKGSFYYHFPDGKEQLAVAAVEWLAAEVDAFLEKLDAAGSDGTQMAIGMAEYAAKGLIRAHRMRGSLITVLAAEAVPASVPIGTALNKAVEGWVSKLSAGFARAGASNPDDCARTVLALLEGATVLARISGRPGDVRITVASGSSCVMAASSRE